MKKATFAFTLVALVGAGIGVWYLSTSSAPATSLSGPATAQNDSSQGTNSGTTPSPQPAPAPAPAPTPVPQPKPSGPKTFTFADVAAHNSAASCYTTINGSVYDVTLWIGKHPGGSKAILSLCGKDGTAKFTAQHGGKPPQEQQLATFKIGTLAQ